MPEEIKGIGRMYIWLRDLTYLFALMPPFYKTKVNFLICSISLVLILTCAPRWLFEGDHPIYGNLQINERLSSRAQHDALQETWQVDDLARAFRWKLSLGLGLIRRIHRSVISRRSNGMSLEKEKFDPPTFPYRCRLRRRVYERSIYPSFRRVSRVSNFLALLHHMISPRNPGYNPEIGLWFSTAFLSHRSPSDILYRSRSRWCLRLERILMICTTNVD